MVLHHPPGFVSPGFIKVNAVVWRDNRMNRGPGNSIGFSRGVECSSTGFAPLGRWKKERARETGRKREKEGEERRGQRKYTFVRGGYVSASFLLLGRTGKPFRWSFSAWECSLVAHPCLNELKLRVVFFGGERGNHMLSWACVSSNFGSIRSSSNFFIPFSFLFLNENWKSMEPEIACNFITRIWNYVNWNVIL